LYLSFDIHDASCACYLRITWAVTGRKFYSALTQQNQFLHELRSKEALKGQRYSYPRGGARDSEGVIRAEGEAPVILVIGTRCKGILSFVLHAQSLLKNETLRYLRVSGRDSDDKITNELVLSINLFYVQDDKLHLLRMWRIYLIVLLNFWHVNYSTHYHGIFSELVWSHSGCRYTELQPSLTPKQETKFQVRKANTMKPKPQKSYTRYVQHAGRWRVPGGGGVSAAVPGKPTKMQWYGFRRTAVNGVGPRLGTALCIN
jgi:hypothetical protein